MNRPRVLTVTRRTIRKNKLIDYTGELHLELLLRLKLLPVMIPVAPGTQACLEQYRDPMHGLLLVEGEDVEPHRYPSVPANRRYLEKTHPMKDDIEIALLRYALAHGVPILGICRGSQLLNVVRGGTLFGDVQKEKQSHRPHIDYHHYDTYRHPVELVPGTPLARWYKKSALRVNSYHHQGVRALGPGLRPMAHADDGLIEAFYDPRCAFVVGLQFHPERMLKEYTGNWRLWQEFGKAVQRFSH